MQIQLKSLPARLAAATATLGALAVFAAVVLHHPHPSVQAVGQSAAVVSDAARATVVNVALGADTSVIVPAEYMIDSKRNCDECAFQPAEYMIDLLPLCTPRAA